MTSRFSRLSVLAFAGALIAGLLAASSADAYSVRAIYPQSPTVAVYNNTGTTYAKTYVYVKCIARSTCYGAAAYAVAGNEGARGHALWTNYSVAAGTGKYIIVKINADQFNRASTTYDGLVPNLSGTPAIGSASGESSGYMAGRLLFRETSPVKQDLPNNVKLVQRRESFELTGSIDGPNDTGFAKTVTLWRGKALQAQRYRTRDLAAAATTFTFGNIGLGYNNAMPNEYRLSVSANVDGERREWFWRGPTGGGSTSGGSSDLRGASTVRPANSAETFSAPFQYGSIYGDVTGTGGGSDPNDVKITIAGAPAVMPSAWTERRDLDVPYCAEVFGSVTTDGGGGYFANFLPRGTDNAYVVKAQPLSGSAMTVWNDQFGSCLHARNYRYGPDAGAATDYSRSNLLKFAGATTKEAPQTTLRAPTSGFSGDIDYDFSAGYYDRYVYVRAYIPGMSILNSPIIKSTAAASNGVYSLTGLPPGKYYLDIGRPVGVSDWYKSRYTNNASHFTAESDRQTEIWKAFARLSYLSGTSTSGYEGIAVKHGASYAPGEQNSSPGSGYAGWMYRDFSPNKYGQGYYAAITTYEGSPYTGSLASPNIRKGATITGHISRQDGRTNKEMMVSAYSIDGVRIMRSAISDGSGNFRITGLAPGTYNIMVNTDSWRGLGRTFTGAHTKSVSGSGFYSVGTLYAKF